MEIKVVLRDIDKELDSENITKQRKRYLEGYRNELSLYLNNHPEEIEVPTSIELFCDSNPDAPECRKYDV